MHCFSHFFPSYLVISLPLQSTQSFICTFIKNTHFSPLLRQISLSDTAETEEWELAQSHCEKFYQVPLTKDKVHFVDTPEALERCQSILLKVQRIKQHLMMGKNCICNHVLFNFLSCVLLSVLSQKGVVVGVDMEWQPTFGCISTQQVALIQLAVSDQVFLIDLCARRFCEHPETICFIRSFFSQQSVLKLGQHVFSVISKSFAFFFSFYILWSPTFLLLLQFRIWYGR